MSGGQPVEDAGHAVGKAVIIGGGVEGAAEEDEDGQTGKGQRQRTGETAAQALDRWPAGVREPDGSQPPGGRQAEGARHSIAGSVHLTQRRKNPAGSAGEHREGDPEANKGKAGNHAVREGWMGPDTGRICLSEMRIICINKVLQVSLPKA